VHGSGSVPDGDLLVFNSESLRAATEHTAPSIVAHPPVFLDEHRTTPGDHVTIVNCSPDKGIRVAWRLAEALDLRFLGVKGGYGEQITPRAPNFETIPTQRDMRDVWERTRILLMPSLHETFGLVALEAACSGIPTIAHPTPGLVESLGPSGIFVDRDDIDGWAREIRRLQDPAEWSAASAAARQRADQLDTAGSLDTFTAAVEGLMACV
jgi:glycosyltransferase involved in cell wall biosynthesis